MGCDYYIETFLTGYGIDAKGTKTDILVSLGREGHYDTAYDSDSEDDRARQRNLRLPKTKRLMTDRDWQISAVDKRKIL